MGSAGRQAYAEAGIPIIGQAPRSVMVATPTGCQMVARTAHNIEALLTLFRSQGLGTGWLPCFGNHPDFGQNMAVHTALTTPHRPDAILFIDSDMVFAPEVGMRLLQRGRDIVAVPYRSRTALRPLGRHLDGREFDTTETGCQEVQSMPSGMLLVKTSVFCTFGYPWFFVSYGTEYSSMTTGDINFCYKAREHGHKVWADFDLASSVMHVGEQLIPWTLP